MMSYSFTDPEDEEETESEINLVEGDFEKPEPRRFMLPVGDLLNHTWDNNARIEFGDDCLTINATKVQNLYYRFTPYIPMLPTEKSTQMAYPKSMQKRLQF